MGFNNEAQSVILKITYVRKESKRETRRSSIPLPSFSTLCDHTRALFATLRDEPLLFTYKDEDGDVITLSSDVELVEAIRLSSLLPTHTLRINVETEDHGAVQDLNYKKDEPFLFSYKVVRGTYGTLFDAYDSTDERWYVHGNGGDPSKYRVYYSNDGVFETVGATERKHVKSKNCRG